MASYSKNERGIVIDGQSFPNVTEACRARGLNSKKIHERIRCGWSIEEALELVPRKRASLEYRARKEAFAKQQGLALSSVECRLSVRRNRIREWLHLPSHTPKRHSNAVEVIDKNNVKYSSKKNASRALSVHRYNLSKHASVFRPIVKYQFETEMRISPETLLLLCSHPNLNDKPDLFRQQGHTLLLDNQVRITLHFCNRLDGGYLAMVSIGDVDLFCARVSKSFQLLPFSLVLRASDKLSMEEKLAREALMSACSRDDGDAFFDAFSIYAL